MRSRGKLLKYCSMAAALAPYLITSITPPFNSSPFKVLNLHIHPSPFTCSHSPPACLSHNPNAHTSNLKARNSFLPVLLLNCYAVWIPHHNTLDNNNSSAAPLLSLIKFWVSLCSPPVLLELHFINQTFLILFKPYLRSCLPGEGSFISSSLLTSWHAESFSLMCLESLEPFLPMLMAGRVPGGQPFKGL